MSNQPRITRAARALDVYYEDDARTAVVDLLSDLRHYCEKHGIDWDSANEMARVHYYAERRSKT